MAREPATMYSMGKDFSADIRWQVLDINKDARPGRSCRSRFASG